MDIALNNVYLFGDSIAKGIIFDDCMGRYTQLKANFAALAADSLGILLQNKAKFGCTIIKGREVVSRVLQSAVSTEGPRYAFLEFGGNDCDYNWKEVSMAPEMEHLPKTAIPEFITTYEEIIQDLHSHEVTPVILTLPPICAEQYFQWIIRDVPSKENVLTWLGGDVEYIYYWHERYNSAVWEVAYKTGSRVIDIRKEFLEQKNYKKFLCTDGIHLNQEGHALVRKVLLGNARDLSR